MIVLDTNILSETLRPEPNAEVMAWLSTKPRATLFTTTVTRGEVLYGVRLLPAGARRQGLWDAAHAIFNRDFAGQILNFDGDAADAYAEIAASRKNRGRPISQFDAMIAAIAYSRGASIATRNTKDFLDCGIDVFDPWQA